MFYRKAVASKKPGFTKAQENPWHLPFARLLQVLTGTILRLGTRRRMVPLDGLNVKPPATYSWRALQAGIDHATCGACPPCWSVWEWLDDSKSHFSAAAARK